MTRSEIIAIQSELGVQADGIWGPITAAAYAARMAHEAPRAPVALPPVSKPWWQSRAVLGLLASVLAMIAGLLAQVETAIAAVEDPVQRQAVQIEWEYAAEVDRNHSWVQSLATALELTEAQLDVLFTQAATL